MTELVQYHHNTTDLALFLSNGKYWIGCYSKFLTHQNDESQYVLIDGYFDTEEDGMSALKETDVDVF